MSQTKGKKEEKEREEIIYWYIFMLSALGIFYTINKPPLIWAIEQVFLAQNYFY